MAWLRLVWLYMKTPCGFCRIWWCLSCLPWSGRGRRFPRPNFSPQIWELLRGYSHTQTNKQEPCHFQCFQSNILILQIFTSTFPESPLFTPAPDRPWCQKNRHASWSRGASENFFDTHISCPNCGKKRVFFEAHVPTPLHCPGFLVPILHKMLFLAQASRPLPASFIPVTVDREKSCVTLCTAIASARQKRACRSRLCLTPSSLCPFAMRYLDVTAPGILLEKALALQDLVHRSMPDQSLFWPDTLDFFADTLAKGGTLVLAVGDQIDTLSARVDAGKESQPLLPATFFCAFQAHRMRTTLALTQTLREGISPLLRISKALPCTPRFGAGGLPVSWHSALSRRQGLQARNIFLPL